MISASMIKANPGEAKNLIDMQERKIERLRLALQDAQNQIDYLHEKFQATGSGNGTVAKIEAILRETI